MTKDELGASEFYAEFGVSKKIKKNVPKIDFEVTKKRYERINRAIDKNLIESCHDCSDGGLAVALAECSFSGDVGIEVNLAKVPVEILLSYEKILFSESAGRFVISTKKENREKFENLIEGINFSNIGIVRNDGRFVIRGNDGGKNGREIINVNIDELRDAWKSPLKG